MTTAKALVDLDSYITYLEKIVESQRKIPSKRSTLSAMHDRLNTLALSRDAAAQRHFDNVRDKAWEHLEADWQAYLDERT